MKGTMTIPLKLMTVLTIRNRIVVLHPNDDYSARATNARASVKRSVSE
jgi:hypothetical protein